MKARLLAALAIFLISGLAPAKSQNNGLDFTSKKDGYSIQFPADWQTKTDPIVNLVAAPESIIKQDAPLPNVKVVVRPMRTGMTIDEVCDLSKKQWAHAWTVESDKHSFGSSVSSEEHTKTPTIYSRRLVIVQDLKVLKTKVLKSFIEANGNYYVISCSDKPENFAKSEATFNQILDSLRFSKPEP